MTKRRKEGSELYHDRVANIYDGMYAGSMYWEFYWTITWNHIKKYLPQKIPSRALDVGCGTGRWGLKLLKSGFHADFLDISEKMLNQVGHKLTNTNSSYE
ncbi:MAG: methyltransferase domain-containing protein, partial [Planctomycetota bacterium]